MQRTAARTTHRFERKRDAILDAATALMNRKGVKGLTLSEAAAAVGLSTTSVTYYFKRKDELAAACMLRGIEAIEAMVEEALGLAEPEARLRRLLDLYLARVGQTAAGLAPPLPLLTDLRALSSPSRETVAQAFMRMFRHARQLFEAPSLADLTRGRRTARTHLLLEQLFWAVFWLPRYDAEDYPRIAGRMFDVLVHGLAVEGAQWSPTLIPVSLLTPPDGPGTRNATFLKAATRLVNARGYRGASVDKISAELHVTKGSFYHHNDAKDDLVVACFERTFEVLRRAQRLAMELKGDEWKRVSSAAASLAEFQLSDEGPLLRAIALSAVPETIRRDMVQQLTRVSDRFASMISDGVAEGSIRPVDPSIASQMLTATLNAAAELRTWAPGVTQKGAPAIFVRPMLTGLFAR